jgi:hypothetical protein
VVVARQWLTHAVMKRPGGPQTFHNNSEQVLVIDQLQVRSTVHSVARTSPAIYAKATYYCGVVPVLLLLLAIPIANKALLD